MGPRMLKIMRSNLSSTWLLLGLACASGACSSADEGGPSNDIPEYGAVPGAGSSGSPGAGVTAAPAAGAPGSGVPGAGAPANGGATEGQSGGALAPPTAGGTAAPGAAAPGTAPGTSAAPGTPADPSTAPAPGTVPAGTPLDGAAPPNFFTTGAWRGLVTTAARVAGTSINPATFDAHTPGTPFCVEGAVQRDPQFLGEATLIFNLAQDATVNGQTEPATETQHGANDRGTLIVLIDRPHEGPVWISQMTLRRQ